MRWVFLTLIGLHALLHLMGFAKAFGLAALPALTQPISPPMGLLWLVAALTLTGAVITNVAWPRGWWLVGAVGLALSQAAIVTAWTDAKFGTLPNVLLLVAVVHGFLTQGPGSFRARFEQDTAIARAPLVEQSAPPLVTEADLDALPRPVALYLRGAGVVGKPRVLAYTVKVRGRIRASPTSPWMPFEADQQSFVEPPARFFLMRATLFGVPIEAFHRFQGSTATMQVKAAGLVTVADARGPDMDRSETVTLFNDLCILAPAALLSPAITWEAIDDRSARGRFTHAGRTVTATLHFDEEGRFIDFDSDDRSRASPDGRSFTTLRWSTPLREYRAFGDVRLAGHGEALWHAPAPEGTFSYGAFDLVDVSYDIRSPR